MLITWALGAEPAPSSASAVASAPDASALLALQDVIGPVALAAPAADAFSGEQPAPSSATAVADALSAPDAQDVTGLWVLTD